MSWKIQKIAQWTGKVIGHTDFVGENIYEIADRFHRDGGTHGDLITTGRAGGVLMLDYEPKEVSWWSIDRETFRDQIVPLLRERDLTMNFAKALLSRLNDSWGGHPADWTHEMVWRAVLADGGHLTDALIDIIGCEETELQQSGPEKSEGIKAWPQ